MGFSPGTVDSSSRFRAGLRAIALVCALLTMLAACSQKTDEPVTNGKTKPNVLLIVLDDFGVNDLGAAGAVDSPTPNLARFAAQGVHYTRHYADASCSVARAALLTGQYPARFGFRPTHLGLSPGTTTIATVLRDAGYSTQHIGKWHVGNATPEQSPLHAGFDQWFGFLLQHELDGATTDGINFGAPTYRDPHLRLNDLPPTKYKGHLTDILTDSAVTYLNDQRATGSPWFLNLWYFAPHSPIQPAPRFARKYENNGKGKYQALIEQLDDSVGRVLRALQDTGQAANTLVIILSDNGGTARFADSNAPYHGRKTEFFEGGVRTPLLIRWPDRAHAGATINDIVSLYDVLPTIARAAGAAIPESAIGRDLRSESLPPSPQLLWEYSDSRTFKISVLSVDGRWRYTQGLWLTPTLNDLEADPTGATNVIADHPEVATSLLEQLRQWRLAQRRVPLDYQVLGESGAARLTGSDYLRSPGYRGFTLALGVTPERQTAQMQTLVYQQDRWGVYSSADNLVVGVLGELMILPPLPSGRCSELVITTHHALSPIQPATNWSSVEIYVNGQLQQSRHSNAPAIMLQGYEHPTFLGQDATAAGVFTGTLSRPLVLSERLTNDPPGGLLRNAVADLPSLCGPAVQARQTAGAGNVQ